MALEGRCAAGSPLRYRDNDISPWLIQKVPAGGHWIDLFRWLLGDEVQTASGMVSHDQHHLEVEDNSFALLRFRGGATAILDISYSVPQGYPAGRDLYIGIRGTEGAISWSPAWGGTADEVFLCSSHAEYVDSPVSTFQVASKAVPGYGGISGLAYLREVAEAIAGGRSPGVTGLDGLRALEVVEAIYRSASSGEAVEVACGDPP